MRAMILQRFAACVVLLMALPACIDKKPHAEPVKAEPAAAAITAPLAASAPDLTQKTCESCRARFCRNYQKQGVDVVAGCLEKASAVDVPSTDTTFIEDCTKAVRCAYEHDCATDSARGVVKCYCGSRYVDECKDQGPAPDAPCAAEWKAATRAATNMEVLLRFDNVAYPSGWAFHLLECDRDRCGASSKVGRCTPEAKP